MMILAASVGWYGSQNTYLLLFAQILDEGPHGIIPPNLPPPEQQAEFAFSNPTYNNIPHQIKLYYLNLENLT